jgi:hypothetical protein
VGAPLKCPDETATITEHCAKAGVCCKPSAALCSDIEICK